jgi:hypothetical protein
MNFFDASIMDFLNGFSQISKSFDAFMVFIVDNNFIKGVTIVSILWFFWFQKSQKIIFNRERIIICIVSLLSNYESNKINCLTGSVILSDSSIFVNA